MKTYFNRQELIKNSDCYLEVMGKTEAIIKSSKGMSIIDILKLPIPLKDKLWYVRNHCQLSIDETITLSFMIAEVLLPYYEGKNPNNIFHAKKAIDTSYKFLKKEASLYELKEKRDNATKEMLYAPAAIASYIYYIHNATSYSGTHCYACMDAMDAYPYPIEYQNRIIEVLIDFFTVNP